jgi:hypothetical protein
MECVTLYIRMLQWRKSRPVSCYRTEHTSGLSWIARINFFKHVSCVTYCCVGLRSGHITNASAVVQCMHITHWGLKKQKIVGHTTQLGTSDGSAHVRVCYSASAQCAVALVSTEDKGVDGIFFPFRWEERENMLTNFLHYPIWIFVRIASEFGSLQRNSFKGNCNFGYRSTSFQGFCRDRCCLAPRRRRPCTKNVLIYFRS